MNKTIRNIFMLLVVGMMSFSAAQAQNGYTIKGTDTFGDGWPAGSLTISVNGVSNSYSLSGDTQDVLGTFMANVGDVIVIEEFCTDAFPTEMGWSICDITGAVVTSGTGSGIAANTCVANVGSFVAADVACGFTLVKGDTFGDSWNGASMNIYVDGVLLANTTHAGGLSSACGFSVPMGALVEFEWASVGTFNGENSITVLNENGETVFEAGPGGHVTGDIPFASDELCPEPCAIVCPTSGSGTWVEQYFLQAGECTVQATIPVQVTGNCSVVEEVIIESNPLCDLEALVGAADGCTNSFVNVDAGTIYMEAPDAIAAGGTGVNSCQFFGAIYQYTIVETGEFCFDWAITDNGVGDEFGYTLGVDWNVTVAGSANLGALLNVLGDSNTGGSGQTCLDVTEGDILAYIVWNTNFLPNGAPLQAEISGLPGIFSVPTLVSTTLPEGTINYQTELEIGEDQIVEISYTLANGDVVSCEVEIDVFGYSGAVSTALACNDDVNISVDEDCMVLIGADIFLEGGPYSCFDEYLVRIRPFGGTDYLELDPWTHETNANGAYLALPAGQHIYEVIDPVTGNTCWGYFTIEDKFPPTLSCGCAPGGTQVTNAVPTTGVLDATSPTADWSDVGLCTPAQDIGDGGANPQAGTSYAEFTFTPTCDGVVTINASTSWGDGQLYAYTSPLDPADVCAGLEAFDGDGNAVNFEPVLAQMSVSAGTTYFLYLASWGTGQSGSFTINVINEDKDCQVFLGTPETTTVYAAECLYQCYDEFNWEVIDQLPGVTIEDNCGAGDLTSNDVWVDGDECGTRILYRNWLLTDPSTGSTSTCTQEFIFQAISVADLSLPPATVVLACGGDSSPAAIAADLGIETAYPHYFVGDKDFDDDGNFIGFVQRAVAVNNNVCNLFASYTDVDITDCPGCPGNKKVIRSWAILDWCDGSTTPYTQIIKASDSEAPNVSAPDITVSVDPWNCVADFYLPCPEHLGDDCYGDNLNYEVVGPAGVTITQVASTLCSTGYQYIAAGAPKTMFDAPHTFTYVATDCCGNVGQYDIAVTVLDNTPPVAIAKENIVISLTSTPGQTNGIAKMYPQSVDNGSHDGDCGPVVLEIRRAEGAPACGNIGVNDHNNNETFNNDVAPLVPSDAAHPEDDRDDTDGGAFVKFCCEDLTDVDANGNAYGSVEVLIRVWDDGNMTGVHGDWVDLNGDGDFQDIGELDNYSDTWAYVRVEDKLAPQIACPADVTLKCDEDYTDTSITGMASGSATCSGIGVSWSDDTNISTCGAGIVYRTWCIDGTDRCCTQKITIDYFSTWNPCDNNAGIVWPRDYTGEDDPADPWCGRNISPADAIDCADTDTGIPTWTDSSCDLIGYSLDSDTFYFESNACFKVLNNWSVINWCIYNQNDADWNTIPNQGLDNDNDGIPNLFDANDNDNVLLDVHGDPILDAAGNEIEAEDSYYYEPTLGQDYRFYFDNQGGLYWVNYILGEAGRLYSVDVWDLILVDGDNGYFGTFDPEAEDDGVADGLYEHVQVVKLIDTEAPEVSAVENCYPVEDNCEVIPPVTAMACDTLSDCGSEWIKWQAEVDIYGDWTVDYVYSSFIADIPANRPFYVEPTQSCEEVSLQLPAPIEGSKAQHRVLWRATDGCGNVTSYTSYFTVEDKKAPTPYCINLSTALMENGEVELWACDFDAGAFDNCTPTDWLRFTFNGPEDGFFSPEETPMWDPETNCQGKVFDCGHFATAQANGGELPVRIYVWDECGNVDFCMVNLRLVDNGGACITGPSREIAGEIYTEEGEMVENVAVQAYNMGTEFMMGQSFTDENGNYGISGAEGGDYDVEAVKNDDYLNGVTTLDLVLIQKHILGLQDLDSPYKLIAADASNDENVSAIDLIQLRKLILGLYDELPNNGSWRFVDAKTTLDSDNPWPFTETLAFTNLANDMMEEDFVGVKVGDVNGSVDTHQFTGGIETEARQADDLVLNAIPTLVGGGEVTIEITSANFNEVSGMQFTMDVAGLELTNVEAGALNVTAENFAVVNGKVTSSWNNDVAVTTSDVLFTLTFTGNNTDAIAINSSITRAEAYVGSDLETVRVALKGASNSDFALLQNEPNPFNNVTVVGFTLPVDGQATLTVYDVTGKVMTKVQGNYNKGYNEIELSKKDINVSGVLYYQLDSGDYTATKKMIILD